MRTETYMDELLVEEQGDAVVFRVRVTPRARQSHIGGLREGALKVALTASPVDGAANQALVKALAAALGVAKSDVVLVRGHRSRDKMLRVHGVAAGAVRALARR
jgi:uncharacterized protein (TIGR00251 family)